MPSTEVNGREYMEDAHGRLVPVDTIDAIDLIRDGLVKRMVVDAQAIQADLKKHKEDSMLELESHIALAAEEHGVVYGGKKGNVTLLSYDGRYKIYKQVADIVVYDEGILIAKELIDKCLTKWTDGGNANIREIVGKAFQVDKMGRFNTLEIAKLLKMDIMEDRETWDKAMGIIKKCRRVVGTSEYIRAYKLKDHVWECIVLDISKV